MLRSFSFMLCLSIGRDSNYSRCPNSPNLITVTLICLSLLQWFHSLLSLLILPLLRWTVYSLRITPPLSPPLSKQPKNLTPSCSSCHSAPLLHFFYLFFSFCFGDTTGGAEMTPHSMLRDLALLAGSEDCMGCWRSTLGQLCTRQTVYYQSSPLLNSFHFSSSLRLISSFSEKSLDSFTQRNYFYPHPFLLLIINLQHYRISGI